MLKKCADAVQAAAKAAGRAKLTPGQLKAIEDGLKKKHGQLARQDPQAWAAMTADQRLTKAAEAVMIDIKAQARRNAELKVTQALVQGRVIEEVKQLQRARGTSQADAVSRRYTLTHEAQRVLASETFGKMADLMAATGDKTGAGLGRRILMHVFNVDNPRMTLDVVREIYAKADGHTNNPTAKAAAQSWLQTIEGLRSRFNAAGGDVGALDYGYVPQSHHSRKVYKAGADAWAQFVMPLLDRSRYLNEDGTPMDDDAMKGWLAKSWQTVATEGQNKSEPGAFKGAGKRANRGADSREIHFKDGVSWAKYMQQFGRGSLYDAMMKHINGITRDITLVEHYGPDANATARLLQDTATWNDGTIQGKPTSAWSVNPQTYWNFISGKVGAPADEDIAQAFKIARDIMVAAKLGGALISSFADVGTLVVTAGYNKLPYWQMLRDIASQGSKETRDFMSVHGMAAESAMHALNRWSSENMAGGWSGHMASSVMRLSLLNAWTDGLRQGFVLSMNAKMAELSRKSWVALDKFDRTRLEQAGITESDWAVLNAVAPESFKGRSLLTPDAIRALDRAQLEAVRPQDLQAVRDRIAAQTKELSDRNAKDLEWVQGRIDKFDEARDALNRRVKDRMAKRLDRNDKATADLLDRMALLDMQREQAKLQAELESDYNKLYTRADIDAFEKGLREASGDLNSVNDQAIRDAEKIGAQFAKRMQDINAKVAKANKAMDAAGALSVDMAGNVTMSTKNAAAAAKAKARLDDADLEGQRAQLERDIAAEMNRLVGADAKAAMRDAINGVRTVRKSASQGISSAEAIGRRYGEAKGRIERRMVELQNRVGKMDQEAQAAANDDAKAAQKKAAEMAKDLQDFIARSKERQANRQHVIDRLTAEESPRLEAEAARVKNSIADKVFSFIANESDYAVVSPDLHTRAIVTGGGLQAGTWGGELARTAMQFKSFPIAMFTRHWDRMLNDPVHDKGSPLANRLIYFGALQATLLGLGAVSFQAKQLLQGKDPIDMNPTNGTGARFWARAWATGGGWGLAADIFAVDPMNSAGDAASTLAKNLTGPAFGSFTELVAKNIVENAWQAAEGKDTHWQAEAMNWAKSNTPGANLWWVKPVLDHAILNGINENLSPGYLARTDQRAWKNWGQRNYWGQGSALPYRAPDLSAAWRQ